MTPLALRQLLRWIHIGSAAVIGTYLYSPWSENAIFAAIVLYGVFPLMALSGAAIWMQGRLARLVTR